MKSKNDAMFEEKIEIWFKKRHEEFGEFYCQQLQV